MRKRKAQGFKTTLAVYIIRYKDKSHCITTNRATNLYDRLYNKYFIWSIL